uniref:Uncharacterized protein n=1 Tax=Pseudo-nitzschia australis TaxID=44445 RepID=A0A7S4ACN0_9STRA
MISITLFLVILSIATLDMLSTVDAFTTPTSSQSTVSYDRNIAVSLMPTPSDFTDASSLLLVKFDSKKLGVGVLAKKTSMIPRTNADITAQVLNDTSHVLMDFPSIFQKTKQPRLRMRYAQVMGRVLVLGTSLLPHHGVCVEETVVQLFLLGLSMKPIIRSIKLYRCIADSKCAEECTIELEDLERSLP